MQQDPYATPSAAQPPPFQPQSYGRMGDDAGLRLLLPVGRSGWAIAAGYLGLFSVLLLPAPFAVLISILAIRDIRRSRETAQVKHGMGRAIFGLIMGALGTLLLGVMIVSYALTK